MERNDEKIMSDYLRMSREFKIRRLIGLAVLCLLLLIPLGIIYINGWWDLAGEGQVGVGWVMVGIAVVISSLLAVVLDLVWRKE